MHVQYGKIQYLDGWRGLAILMVLISHFFNMPGIREGRLGVDLFFVLSGLLMANILFLKRPPLGTFYKRRISRVLPLAFLYITVVYIGSLIIGQDFTATEVISSYLFLRTYIPETPHIWSSNVPIDHFWSLNVEEHCYLLMGLMTFFIRNSTRAGCMLVVLGLAAIVTDIGYVYSENRPIESSLRTECASAPLFLSAGYFLIKHRLNFYYHPVFTLLSLIAGVLCYTPLLPWWFAYAAPFCLAYTINNMYRAPKIMQKILCIKVLRYLGILSFSIYVWQQPLFENKDILLGTYTIILVFVISILSYHLFEGPVRVWLNNNW